MTQAEYEAFIAGRRPDDVLFFLAETDDDLDGSVPDDGHAVPGGRVYVVPGDRGRRAFSAATGTDVMSFARSAMGTTGEIDTGLNRGTCPECGETDHPRHLFAFAEARNEDVGGMYARGPVVHAYAACPCGAVYSDRWVADEDA